MMPLDSDALWSGSVRLPMTRNQYWFSFKIERAIGERFPGVSVSKTSMRTESTG